MLQNLGEGLEKLNFLSFFKQFPILRHLLQREKKSLRPIQLLKLFDVRYSEASSTAFNRQKTIFSLFTKYVREVASVSDRLNPQLQQQQQLKSKWKKSRENNHGEDIGCLQRAWRMSH